MTTLEREARALDELRAVGPPGRLCRTLERGQLPPRRHVVGRPEDQADAVMSEVGEVRVRLLHRDRVVGRDAREVEVVCRRVDENDGQAQLQEPHVVLVGCVRLCVLTAGEDHARDLSVKEHLDVLGLRHAARPRTQHRVEASLGERSGDDFGDGWEDGVLELRNDETDHPRAPRAQVRGPVVADHIQRRENSRTRRFRHARLPIEDTTDGRLAHSRLPSDVHEPSSHVAIL